MSRGAVLANALPAASLSTHPWQTMNLCVIARTPCDEGSLACRFVRSKLLQTKRPLGAGRENLGSSMVFIDWHRLVNERCGAHCLLKCGRFAQVNGWVVELYASFWRVLLIGGSLGTCMAAARSSSPGWGTASSRQLIWCGLAAQHPAMIRERRTTKPQTRTPTKIKATKNGQHLHTKTPPS